MIDWVEIKKVIGGYNLFVKKQKPSISALEAAHFNVDYIRKNYSAPYYIFLSGGVDSQAMLWAWHTSNADFIPVSITYNKDLNFHDLDNLKLFSQLHNIKINYFDFDVINFLESEFESYSEKYRCGSPHICTYIKMSEIIKDGTVIFSGDMLNPNSPVFPDRNNWGLYRYADCTGRSFVPYFFIETIEMAWSFQHFFKNKGKYDVYQKNGFPVIPQNSKITGFEKIKEYYDTKSINIPPIEKLKKIPGQGSNRNFDILFRNRYEYKYRKDIYQVNYYNES